MAGFYTNKLGAAIPCFVCADITVVTNCGQSYHAIVPDLTAEEEKTILGFLKQAREEAVDYKNMTQISAIFEIYKTKSEQHLNSNGRDWKKLYKAYTDAAKAKKAEAARQQAKPTQ